MDLKRGINLAIDKIIKILYTNSKRIYNTNEIAKVATIFANGDQRIGLDIVEAMKRVGEDGIITIEEGKSSISEMEIVEGIKLDKGYISPYFVTNNEKMACELESPYILVYNNKVSNLLSILLILETIVRFNKSLLIIVDDIEGEALSALIINKIKANIKVAGIKAPGFGERKKQILEDIAILTGAMIINENTNIKLENITLDNLGKASKATVFKDSTVIIGGFGDKFEIINKVK